MAESKSEIDWLGDIPLYGKMPLPANGFVVRATRQRQHVSVLVISPMQDQTIRNVICTTQQWREWLKGELPINLCLTFTDEKDWHLLHTGYPCPWAGCKPMEEWVPPVV